MTRRPQRAAKRRKQFVWTAAQNLGTTLTGTNQEEVIITGADWAVAASQRATLMSIRGWLNVSAIFQAATDTCSAFVLRIDTDIPSTSAALDPQTIQNYVDEDVLWTYKWRSPGQDVTAVETPAFTSVEINIKSMRRVTAGEDIRLFINSTNNGRLSYNSILRGLIKVGD